jgi:hypothetical protein
MREVQVRISVNVLRHHGEVNSYNSYNNNGGFSRNNNRGRGFDQRNQAYQKTTNNYSTSANAPTFEPNAGVRD